MALPHTGASGGLVRNIARPETGRADVREGSPRHRHENMFCNSRPYRGLGVALRQEETRQEETRQEETRQEETRQEETHVNEHLLLALRRQFATDCRQGRSAFKFLDLAQLCRVWSRCSGTKNA